MEKLVNGNRYLTTDAKEAFKSYVRAYASHSTKEVFNVQRLDVQKVAKCFALKESPIFDLSTHFYCFSTNKSTFEVAL